MRSSVSSTPARGDAPNFTTQLPNFDVSHIPKLAPTNVQGMNITHVGNVTESSSFIKTMEEAVRDLKKMKEVKIEKFKGGYCSSAALKFNSWLKDVEASVNERGLTNMEAMKLVKDLTEESVRSEVEFHLDTNLEATYDSLLNHLRMAFQMSETFETLIAQFYSKTQRSKETFDEYGDYIQNLGRQIIAVNPEWRKESNAAMKHQLITGMQDIVLQPLARTHIEASTDLSYTAIRAKLARLFNTRVKGKQPTLLASTKNVTTLSQSVTTSQETQTERSCRWNNQNDLNKEVIPGVDGKTWEVYYL